MKPNCQWFNHSNARIYQLWVWRWLSWRPQALRNVSKLLPD
jgi:hypothetical protein